ncbi:MAG: NAD(P)-binding domain-containing protein, partial [Candidatus Humimicrobiaceae bacterium]
MPKQNMGLIGLAVMGQNLVLNMESKGYSVAVYNRTVERTKEFIQSKAKEKNITGTYSFKELANSLERPRKIMLMVKAGKPVDDNIEELIPFLEPGDLIIDGGNSFFKDTIRREKYLREKNKKPELTESEKAEVLEFNKRLEEYRSKPRFCCLHCGGNKFSKPKVKIVLKDFCAGRRREVTRDKEKPGYDNCIKCGRPFDP